MALVIICRQIDISVGSQFAVCSVCAGLLAAMNWPLALVLPASIALGALMGAFNGALVAGLRSAVHRRHARDDGRRGAKAFAGGGRASS